MRVAVFTARSTGIGIATGVLVAAVFGQFVGASWGLAILAGLPAGALALAASIRWHDGRFDPGTGHQRRPGDWLLALMIKFDLVVGFQRRPGVWLLTWFVIFLPAFFLMGNVIETELSPSDRLAFMVVLLTTGVAAYALGGVMTTLKQLDADDAVDPRLDRVTQPPGEVEGAS